MYLVHGQPDWKVRLYLGNQASKRFGFLAQEGGGGEVLGGARGRLVQYLKFDHCVLGVMLNTRKDRYQ